MAALNLTSLENVVPVRIDLSVDYELFTHVLTPIQVDLTLDGGGAWDLTDGGAVDTADLNFTIHLREVAGGTLISTGVVSTTDSNFAGGIVVFYFPAGELTASWADRELQWAMALSVENSTGPIPITYGRVKVNSFVADATT